VGGLYSNVSLKFQEVTLLTGLMWLSFSIGSGFQ